MAGAAGTCLRLGGQGVPGGTGAMASQVPLVTHVIKQLSVCSLVLLRFVYRAVLMAFLASTSIPGVPSQTCGTLFSHPFQGSPMLPGSGHWPRA